MLWTPNRMEKLGYPFEGGEGYCDKYGLFFCSDKSRHSGLS
jgi:hypothetical protein